MSRNNKLRTYWTSRDIMRVHYLRGEKGMEYIDIAKELGRSEASVSSTYSKICMLLNPSQSYRVKHVSPAFAEAVRIINIGESVDREHPENIVKEDKVDHKYETTTDDLADYMDSFRDGLVKRVANLVNTMNEDIISRATKLERENEELRQIVGAAKKENTRDMLERMINVPEGFK